MITEPINYLTPYVEPGQQPPDMTIAQMALLGALFGFLVGLALGAAEALSGVSPRDAVKSVLIGAFIGTLGGALGITLGNQLIFIPLLKLSGYRPGDPLAPLTPLAFLIILVGRSAGWALIGLVVGLAQGLATESTRKMINGMIGGFLGGLIGGFIFQIFSELLKLVPEMLRLIGFTITTASIGLFIGFIEEFTKRAWIVHLKGRNEGRQFQIFKPETVVGRDELIDVPVFGDPDIEPRHFIIKADQHRHLIKDLNTIAGTMVNGQKVQQQVLKDGDIIQVGMTKFLFRDKATRSLIPRTVDPYTATGVSIPTSGHVCPFCGSIKDASGNCSCTVGAPSATANPPPGQTVQTTVTTQPTPDPFLGTPLAAPGAGARLVGTYGPYSGQVFNLNTSGETTIGRQSDQNISLSGDNTVSRRHSRVACENGQFVLYDQGSANGTHVNNNQITRHVLTLGDLIQIGSTKFRYEE